MSFIIIYRPKTYFKIEKLFDLLTHITMRINIALENKIKLRGWVRFPTGGIVREL